jgi:hypothetical protein
VFIACVLVFVYCFSFFNLHFTDLILKKTNLTTTFFVCLEYL